MAPPSQPPSDTSRPTSSSNHISPTRDPPVLQPVPSGSSAVSSPTTTPLHTPHKLPASPRLSHRSLLAENIRQGPPSPRAQRTQSFSEAALTELLMQPSTSKANGVADERFKGRDWRTIQVHEIIDPVEARFVELDTDIEQTTKLLIRSGSPNVVLVRESRTTRTVLDLFGYDELMAYLLLVLGITHSDELAAQLAKRARAGEVLPLRDVFDHLGQREPPTFLHSTASLMQAMEVLGSGLHRVVICKEGTSEAIGVLSQLRLVRFFWEHHTNFATTEPLYSRTLHDLEMGAKVVVAINGDKPLADALRLMHEEGITSLPVLDNQNNVVGNISHVDTRLLTDTSAIPLLGQSCIHFIGVILSERGVQDGKDAFPVFHVTPHSTLAHTVAKLCATLAHRVWIVQAPSPSGSVPPSPGPGIHHVPPFSIGSPTHAPNLAPARSGSVSESVPGPMSGHPGTGGNPSTTAVSAAQLPGAAMSGRLSGVVSLTDVLNLLARASGLSPRDPDETRRRRRRSSSGSARVTGESNPDLLRSSGEILRSQQERSASRGSVGRR